MADDEQFNWDSNTWDVIDTYYRDNQYYITQHQLNSYNQFITEQLPKTLRQFNPITLNYTDSGTSYKIQIYLGATLSIKDGVETILNDGQQVYIGKPVLYEKGESKQLYPNEARLKNLTYSAPIFTSLYVKYIITEADKNPVIKIVKNIYDTTRNLFSSSEGASPSSKKSGVYSDSSVHSLEDFELGNDVPLIHLGKVPIMLHSRSCVLHNQPRALLYQMGECPYDQGGYFVIDGKEKVIVAQEFQTPNQIIVATHKGALYSHSANIRSEEEDTFEPARTTNLQLYERYGKLLIKVVFPGMDNPSLVEKKLSLVTVFRMLGAESDKEICGYVGYDLKNPISKRIIQEFRDSLMDNNGIYSQTDALEYMRQNFIPEMLSVSISEEDRQDPKKMSEYTKMKENKDKIEMTYIHHILRKNLIPHAGREYTKKLYFLGYMTRQLLETKIGIRKKTDRDSYINKRVDISGILVASLFRDLYFRFKNHVEHTLNREFHQKARQNFWAGEPVLIHERLIHQMNYKKVFTPNIINEGFHRAFKVCWNLKGTECNDWQKAVVQDLNRLSYVGASSHIRRVHTPIPKGAKMRAPHSLNATTWGTMCPAESPDGANVGIIKHLSVMGTITFGCSSRPIRTCLWQYHTLRPEQVCFKDLQYLTKIIVNGSFVGVHRDGNMIYSILKELKQCAYINIYTSISWNVLDNIITIWTDSGRCIRPLYIVQNNKILITNKMIKDLKDHKLEWNHLLGTVPGYNSYDCSFGSPPFEDDISKNRGCIEYIDVDEMESAMIAMKGDDIENNPDSVVVTNYTHCEIHPYLILGVQGSSIPFPDHNASVRNTFSGAQGKQAIGIYATNFRNRMDSESRNVLYYPQKSIVQTRLTKYYFLDKLAYGENAIVAIACYTGYNQEDAVIINGNSLERGLFRTLSYRTYVASEGSIPGSNDEDFFEKPDSSKYNIVGMKSGDYENLNPETGVIKEFNSVIVRNEDGEEMYTCESPIHVDGDEVLIGKLTTTSEKTPDGMPIVKDTSVYVRHSEYGIVDKVFMGVGENNNKFAKVRLRKIKIPEIGDKFASRAGQKGTIGMILPQEDMPVTKEGIVPDIIVNPHAIPSRMTIGQLLECVLGKVCCAKGTLGDSTPFTNMKIDPIAELLEEHGYEKYANEILYNGQIGTQLKCAIFIGPTYYQRLKHMVQDKMHSRGGGGPKMSLTKQPASGRGRGGGLRIGEMERDALMSHGVTGFLKETMMERADGPSKEKNIPSLFIDSKNGLSAPINTAKKIYKSSGTDNKFTFSEVHIPYATKLFFQEMEAMGIGPRLLTKNSKQKWKKIPYTEEEKAGTRLDFIIEDKIIIDAQYVKHIIGAKGKVKRALIANSNLESLEISPTTRLDKQIIILRGTSLAIQKAQQQIYDIIDMLKQRLFISSKTIFVPTTLSMHLLRDGAAALKELRTKYGNKVYITIQRGIIQKKMVPEDALVQTNKITIKGPEQLIENLEKDMTKLAFLYPPETNDYYNPQKWSLEADKAGLPIEYEIVIQLGKYLVFKHEPSEEDMTTGNVESYIYYYNMENGKATTEKPAELYYMISE